MRDLKIQNSGFEDLKFKVSMYILQTQVSFFNKFFCLITFFEIKSIKICNLVFVYLNSNILIIKIGFLSSNWLLIFQTLMCCCLVFCPKAGSLCFVYSRRESYLLNTNNRKARAHSYGGAPDSFRTENSYIVGIFCTEVQVLTTELRRDFVPCQS